MISPFDAGYNCTRDNTVRCGVMMLLLSVSPYPASALLSALTGSEDWRLQRLDTTLSTTDAGRLTCCVKIFNTDRKIIYLLTYQSRFKYHRNMCVLRL